jgi:hypothetical protein
MGSEQVSEFIKRVESLYEVEYGDFKRKVGLYINRLEQEFRDPQSRQIIQEMRQHVLYSPTADIETAREKTLQLARKLQ